MGQLPEVCAECLPYFFGAFAPDDESTSRLNHESVSGLSGALTGYVTGQPEGLSDMPKVHVDHVTMVLVPRKRDLVYRECLSA
jgi:hypothetical protein